MNTATENFLLRKVIKVYRNGYSSNKFYLETCDVKQNSKGEDVLFNDTPLDQSIMKKIIQATYNDEGDTFNKGLINPFILSCEPKKYKRHIIWYNKPKVVEMKFNIAKGAYKDGLYSMPGLLYFLFDEKLKVFALRNGNKKPDLTTKLYYAPLHNLTTGYELCMGSVKNHSINIENVDDEIKFWENVIWNSYFNKDGTVHLKRPLKEVYKQCYGGKEKFPTSVLVDTEKTIQNLIDML